MDESVTKNFGNLAVASPDTVQVQEPGKALRLSALIREGCVGTVQGFDCMNTHGTPCALGAANLVLGRMGEASVFDHFSKYDHVYVAHPVDKTNEPFWGTIIELNDDYRWSRERIADWLESQGY